ncbi:MAG TPA: hypothetical protein VMS22_11850, partial [Candidatus Eisenbacteria bacterium]|nr:hypothetical protein [Candidatus Eisenbacteria bacterium]
EQRLERMRLGAGVEHCGHSQVVVTARQSRREQGQHRLEAAIRPRCGDLEDPQPLTTAVAFR